MGNTEDNKSNSTFNPVNVTRGIGAVILTTAITITGVAIAKEEKNINHATTYCPFSNVLGLKHQANAINREGTYLAEYHYAGEDKEIVNAEVLTMDTGKIFTAPNGYTLRMQVGDTFITGNSIVYDDNAKTFTVYNDVKIDYLDNVENETITSPSQSYTINAEFNEGFIYALKSVYHEKDYVEVYSSNAGVNSNEEVIAKTLVNTITKKR